jgi:hypothetical protein
MAAGYSVDLAESDKRAREVLAHSRIALIILAGDHSGIPVFDLDGNSTGRSS